MVYLRKESLFTLVGIVLIIIAIATIIHAAKYLLVLVKLKDFGQNVTVEMHYLGPVNKGKYKSPYRKVQAKGVGEWGHIRREFIVPYCSELVSLPKIITLRVDAERRWVAWLFGGKTFCREISPPGLVQLLKQGQAHASMQDRVGERLGNSRPAQKAEAEIEKTGPVSTPAAMAQPEPIPVEEQGREFQTEQPQAKAAARKPKRNKYTNGYDDSRYR